MISGSVQIMISMVSNRGLNFEEAQRPVKRSLSHSLEQLREFPTKCRPKIEMFYGLDQSEVKKTSLARLSGEASDN